MTSDFSIFDRWHVIVSAHVDWRAFLIGASWSTTHVCFYLNLGPAWILIDVRELDR